MGTNYYAHFDCCPTCSAPKKRVHIGKASGGWEFLFHGYPGEWDEVHATSAKEWAAVLRGPGVKIVDEYGREHETEAFIAEMQDRRGAGQGHYAYLLANQHRHGPIDPRRDWKDDEGYSFTAGNFS